MKPSTKRVLTTLRAAGENGATTGELCTPAVGGARFGARIGELRDDGYVIEQVRVRDNQSRYWLRYEPVSVTPAPEPVRDDAVVAFPATQNTLAAAMAGAHIPGVSYCGCDACLQDACEAPADHRRAHIPPVTAAGYGQLSLVAA